MMSAAVRVSPTASRVCRCALSGALLAWVLAGCQRDQPAATAPTPATPNAAPAAPAAPAADAAPALTDISERDPRFVVGITFPPDAKRFTPLATEIKRYADDARKELDEAVKALGEDKPPAPYELSLTFTLAVENPRVVAVSAEGGLYTGGAHSNPLVARFVWLPQRQAMLTIDELVPAKAGLGALSDYVREALRSSLSQRLDGDDIDPAARAEMLRTALKMIDDGSAPDAENFRQFEPVMAPDGRVAALRFVFPPYQVGPYVDGEQSVEVPAAVLRPHIAPAFAELFDTPAAAASSSTAPAASPASGASAPRANAAQGAEATAAPSVAIPLPAAPAAAPAPQPPAAPARSGG